MGDPQAESCTPHVPQIVNFRALRVPSNRRNPLSQYTQGTGEHAGAGLWSPAIRVRVPAPSWRDVCRNETERHDGARWRITAARTGTALVDLGHGPVETTLREVMAFSVPVEVAEGSRCCTSWKRTPRPTGASPAPAWRVASIEGDQCGSRLD